MGYIIVKNTLDDTFTLCIEDTYLQPHEIVVAEGEDRKELLEAYPNAEDLT